MKFHFRYKFFLFMVIFTTTMSMLLMMVVAPALILSKKVVTLGDGGLVILKTNGPIEVLAYSDDLGKNGATLFDEEGVAVLKTEPGVKPGYFEGKTTLNHGGSYTLKGDSTSLIFKGENFVGYDDPDLPRRSVIAGLAFSGLWIVVTFFFCLSMSYTKKN